MAFDPETFEDILARVAEGETLRSVSRDPEMPSFSTIHRWINSDAEDASERWNQYARARNIGLDSMAEETLEIADDSDRDFDDEGRYNGEAVQRSRLRCDQRRWHLSKLRPDKYGDISKIQNELSGPSGGPIETLSKVELVPVKPISRKQADAEAADT